MRTELKITIENHSSTDFLSLKVDKNSYFWRIKMDSHDGRRKKADSTRTRPQR